MNSMILEKKTETETSLAITCIASLIFFAIAISNNHASAGNSEYGKDHINWKKFQNSNEYKGASNKEQKCLSKAHNLGNNLAGYEVRDCLH